MGELWRASKSRLVSKIRTASNDEELDKLKPDNIPSMHDWNDFIKDKTSANFKAKSKKFQEMKKKQLPHMCSRRGYARLAEDMKNSCSNSTAITRVMVWTKAHMKKDGQPINSQVANTLERIEQNTSNEEMSHSTNMVDDAISKVLGPDRGHMRGLGFGVTKSKLFLSTQKDQTIASLEKKCNNLTTSDVNVLKNVVSSLLKDKEKMSEQTSNNTVNVSTSAHVQASIFNSPPET